MLRTSPTLGTAALSLLLGTAACSDDVLTRPVSATPIDVLFTRYIAMGNSITAGFQSGGVNETTQLQSYAVLLAAQMQSPFFVPLMTLPGCPSLYTNVFTQTRASAIPCALRKPQSPPPPFISNVSVPGAEVLDGVANLGPGTNANQLTVFFLGGLTQAQMMQKGRPTFVSVWLGNNDVLGAATNAADAGNPALVTPPATFTTNYNQVLAEIDDVSPAGGVLVGVANVTGIPFFSSGQTYFVVKNTPPSPLPPLFVVGPACAPRALGGIGDSVLVPFPFAGTKIARAQAGVADTLYCTEAQTIQPAELGNLVSAITAYNQTISQAASSLGWAYYDPNPTLDSLRAVGGATPPVRPFPLFGQPCTANPFGTAFSCDAVHPSATTHRLITNKLIDAINAKYTTALQRIP